MKKELNLEMINSIVVESEEELEEVFGAGHGVVLTVSHECAMNTWQFMFTCC